MAFIPTNAKESLSNQPGRTRTFGQSEGGVASPAVLLAAVCKLRNKAVQVHALGHSMVPETCG